MTLIDFYLDFAAPESWLAFMQLPTALQGLSHAIAYHPLPRMPPAAAAPAAPGMPPPEAAYPAHAATPPGNTDAACATDAASMTDTAWTWPAGHSPHQPFDPLPLLHLAWASASPALPEPTPSRWACELILRHIWQGGHAVLDARRLAALTAQVLPAGAPAHQGPPRLQAACARAARHSLPTTPAWQATGRIFSGAAALPALRAHLQSLEKR